MLGITPMDLRWVRGSYSQIGHTGAIQSYLSTDFAPFRIEVEYTLEVELVRWLAVDGDLDERSTGDIEVDA